MLRKSLSCLEELGLYACGIRRGRDAARASASSQAEATVRMSKGATTYNNKRSPHGSQH